MFKNPLQLMAKKSTPSDQDIAPIERRPLGPVRQLPAAAAKQVAYTSHDSDSTIRPHKASNAATAKHGTPSTLRGEVARAAHPLPAALQNVDPYASNNPAPPRRPCAPGLRRKKSDSTLQVHKENTLAELAAPPKDNEIERKAREKWRYMLGGRLAHPPQVVGSSSTQAIVEKALHVDEVFLKRCERSTVGLSQEQRAEVTHIARYGLSTAMRERAQEVLKKQDPYLRLLWRKVNNPAAQSSQTSKTSGAAHKAKHCKPSIRLLQRGQHGGRGAQATPSIAEVTSDSGARYLVAEPSSSGSFKRFSVGLTEHGRPIGVLLMRGPGSRDVFGDAEGEDLDLIVIDEEIKNLSAYSDAFEIYDAFPVHNVWYVMVPLYDAGSLGDTFARLDPELRYAAGLRLFPSMIEQIVSLHTKHEVLHRDVKMDNFFCTQLGDVVLADFGLTEKLNPNKAVNEGFGGTFFAPEQIFDMRVTQAVDFWSLGASLGDLFIPMSRSPTAPRNPHIPVYDDAGEYDVEAHMAQVNLFGRFRKLLFDNKDEGLFDPNRLSRIQLSSKYDPKLINIVQYYREFNIRAPLLARFCLEHLLEPNPALRSKENAEVLLQLARIMADALGVSQASSETRKLPVDLKIAAAVEALHAAQAKFHQREAQAA